MRCHVIWCEVMWCDAMEWDGMLCGWNVMWLCNVVGCEVMWWDVVVWCGELGDDVLWPTTAMPLRLPFQRAVKPWDAKRNKTTESPCHSITIPYYKALLRTIVLQCTTKCYSMLQNYANVPRSTTTTTMLLRTTLYYSVLHSTTSSAAQGGGGSSKNRKPLGEIGCCVSRMAEQKRWWMQLSNCRTDQRTIWCSDYVTTWKTDWMMAWLTDCLLD